MKLLLFDVDGVLTATAGDDARLLAAAVGDVAGCPVPSLAALGPFPEPTHAAIVRIALQRLGSGPVRERDVLGVRDNYVRRWASGVESGALRVASPAGAREILAEARTRRDFVVALVSGDWAPAALLKLQEGGLAGDGLVLTTCEDDEILRNLLGSAAMIAAAGRGVPGFSSVLFVGDSMADASAAVGYGAGFVGVAPDPERASELRAAGAVAVFPHLVNRRTFWDAVERASARRGSAPGN